MAFGSMPQNDPTRFSMTLPLQDIAQLTQFQFALNCARWVRIERGAPKGKSNCAKARIAFFPMAHQLRNRHSKPPNDKGYESPPQLSRDHPNGSLIGRLDACHDAAGTGP